MKSIKQKFNCPHCNFKGTFTTPTIVQFCPSCKKNFRGKKEKPLIERIFGSSDIKPFFRYEKTNVETPEFADSLARLESARAEKIRAEKALKEPEKTLHIHMNQKQKLKQQGEEEKNSPPENDET